MQAIVILLFLHILLTILVTFKKYFKVKFLHNAPFSMK